MLYRTMTANKYGKEETEFYMLHMTMTASKYGKEAKKDWEGNAAGWSGRWNMRWEMETWRNYFGREFVGIFGAGFGILPLRFTKLKTKSFYYTMKQLLFNIIVYIQKSWISTGNIYFAILFTFLPKTINILRLMTQIPQEKYLNSNSWSD